MNNTYKKFLGSLKRLRFLAGLLSLSHKFTWVFYAIFLVFMLTPVLSSYSGLVARMQEYIVDVLSSWGVDQSFKMIIFVVLFIAISLFGQVFIRLFARLKKREIRLVENFIRSLFPKSRFSTTAHAGDRAVRSSRLFKLSSSSLVAAYGILKTKTNERDITLLDIGLKEETKKQKAGDRLVQVPILGSLVMMYRYVFKSIISNKLVENIYYNFRGVFAETTLDDTFNGEVLIIPNKLGTDPFSQMIKSLDKSRGEFVELENDAFNQAFTVYASDQVEARYLLSLSLMELILDLQAESGKPLSLSFTEGKVYLALYMPDGVFAFGSKKAMQLSYLQTIHKQIKHVMQILELVGSNKERG